jgi:hypothetical protein
MGTFKTVKTFYAPVSLIPGIADEIKNVLSGEGYEVKHESLIGGGYDVSVTKGGLFKAAVGMKTALKIDIHPQGNAIYMEAGVGIFGQQAIPTIISMFFLWPVLLTQLWGMIQQSQLDERVIAIAEAYITGKQSANSVSESANVTGQSGKFCPVCGYPQPATANFCGNCGAKQ